jgi:hypothetical protein
VGLQHWKGLGGFLVGLEMPPSPGPEDVALPLLATSQCSPLTHPCGRLYAHFTLTRTL